MTIEELKTRHNILGSKMITTNILANKQAKLSIQFAISVLEDIVVSYKEDIDQETRNLTEWGLGYRGCSLDTLDGLNCKIQELKQYLDETNSTR